MKQKRIHLNENEFTIPSPKHWTLDEDVELIITLRSVALARKVMKQILSDQKKIEKLTLMENSKKAQQSIEDVREK